MNAVEFEPNCSGFQGIGADRHCRPNHFFDERRPGTAGEAQDTRPRPVSEVNSTSVMSATLAYDIALGVHHADVSFGDMLERELEGFAIGDGDIDSTTISLQACDAQRQGRRGFDLNDELVAQNVWPFVIGAIDRPEPLGQSPANGRMCFVDVCHCVVALSPTAALGSPSISIPHSFDSGQRDIRELLTPK